MGAPIQIDLQKKKFLEAFKKSLGNVSISAEAANISRKTYYNWCKQDPKFAEAAEDIVAGAGDYVEGKLLKAIREDSVTGIIFYCKTKLKDRGYIESTQITGKDGGPVEINDAKAALLRGLIPDASTRGADSED